MFEDFPNGVLGGIVDADVNAADIFPNQPQHDQDETAHKKDRGDNRTPPHLNGRVNQLSDDYIETIAEAKEGGGCSA